MNSYLGSSSNNIFLSSAKHKEELANRQIEGRNAVQKFMVIYRNSRENADQVVLSDEELFLEKE